MKKSKLLALLLAAAMLCGAILPGLQVNAADGDDAGTSDTITENGMTLKKNVTDNGDGTYKIHLEAYATGEKTVTPVTTEIPTDIVLVLDQSGSMKDDVGTVSFEQYGNRTTNETYFGYRRNGGSGNLWHRLADGTYVSVSVTRENVEHTQITNWPNNNYYDNSVGYWNNRNNLYASVNGTYQKVTVTRELSRGQYIYTYELSNGTTVGTSQGDWSQPSFTGIDGRYLYLASGSAQTVYTYTYTDTSGNTQTIGAPSTGANTVFTPTLYRRVTGTANVTRLEAIKEAATAFVNAVAEKAAGADGDITTTADNINHRIAVVGFASKNDYGYNTELLSITGNNSSFGNGGNRGSVGVRYNNIIDQNLVDVVQDMDTTTGKNMVTSAINALAANGATEINLGMDMAERILNANPVPEGEKRNRVVIVFTDGSPTTSNGFEKAVASDAIRISDRIKATGATVYSIGVFSGADATSEGAEPSDDLGASDTMLTAACNWFMQKVSANNGTPRTPSYYLSAGDTDSLNNIFQQISDNISTGGSDVTLDENTVIRDIITPQFEMINGKTTDVTLTKYKYLGGEVKSDSSWENVGVPEGVTAEIYSTDDTQPTTTNNGVKVTGFNFKDEWVGMVKNGNGETPHGHKIVIEFDIKTRDGFLGGNDVITNTSDSGIYEDDKKTDPVNKFPVPDVDVEIKNADPSIPDANVYLGAYFEETVTKEDIEKNTKIKVGGYDIDLSAPNYGLEDWQVGYIDIDIDVTLQEGSLENITDDVSYTIKVTVKPKGDTTGKEAEAPGKINVFKPVLNFKDSTVFYGDNAPENPKDYDGVNLTNTRWQHAADNKWSTDSDVTMMGNAPALTLAYTPNASQIVDGKIVTKLDIPVAVKVTMPVGKDQNPTDVTQFTTFIHDDCSESNCTWNKVKTDDGSNGSSPAFLLHVKTCDLTITKTGGASGEPYVFNILRNNQPYTQATIVGNNTVTIVELPVGTYTVQEDMGWSWRYQNPAGVSNGVNLSAEQPMGTITVTNKLDVDSWLNGYSEVIRNILNGPTHNN